MDMYLMFSLNIMSQQFSKHENQREILNKKKKEKLERDI